MHKSRSVAFGQGKAKQPCARLTRTNQVCVWLKNRAEPGREASARRPTMEEETADQRLDRSGKREDPRGLDAGWRGGCRRLVDGQRCRFNGGRGRRSGAQARDRAAAGGVLHAGGHGGELAAAAGGLVTRTT